MKSIKVYVEGIPVDLTPDQIKHVEKALAERKKACNTFAKCLKYFGFKKIAGMKYSYENEEKEWYAEIFHDRVLLGGKDLPRDPYPPGLVVHWSVNSIINELQKHD
ncbi:hypothetical protein [Albibacterium profundi]|uniref:Uncharacterized protein n=1 Tax=Albibacterium profundi TaxID=3134906 RepID=A0ABV5CF22_9SPHI